MTLPRKLIRLGGGSGKGGDSSLPHQYHDKQSASSRYPMVTLKKLQTHSTMDINHALALAYWQYATDCKEDGGVPDLGAFKAGFYAALQPFPIVELSDPNGLQMVVTHDDGENLELQNVYKDGEGDFSCEDGPLTGSKVFFTPCREDLEKAKASFGQWKGGEV